MVHNISVAQNLTILAFLLKMSGNQAAFLKSFFFDLQICVIRQKYSSKRLSMNFEIWVFYYKNEKNTHTFFRFSIPHSIRSMFRVLGIYNFELIIS